MPFAVFVWINKENARLVMPILSSISFVPNRSRGKSSTFERFIQSKPVKTNQLQKHHCLFRSFQAKKITYLTLAYFDALAIICWREKTEINCAGKLGNLFKENSTPGIMIIANYLLCCLLRILLRIPKCSSSQITQASLRLRLHIV